MSHSLPARLLRTPDCPHADPTAERLRDVANLLGVGLDLEDVVVEDEEIRDTLERRLEHLLHRPTT